MDPQAVARHVFGEGSGGVDIFEHVAPEVAVGVDAQEPACLVHDETGAAAAPRGPGDGVGEGLLRSGQGHRLAGAHYVADPGQPPAEGAGRMEPVVLLLGESPPALHGQGEGVEVGVMGHPEKATPELGQKIVDEMVTSMCERFERLERERGECREVPWTPEPIVIK